jgi:hypothetical protein
MRGVKWLASPTGPVALALKRMIRFPDHPFGVLAGAATKGARPNGAEMAPRPRTDGAIADAEPALTTTRYLALAPCNFTLWPGGSVHQGRPL